jgi:large exoprotein involved in heme utilization and adhesion
MLCTKHSLLGNYIALFLPTFIILAFVGEATAQIIPDNSLGAETSVVNPDVINNVVSDRISGGARRGSNLFHSFQDFNVGEGNC